MAITQNPVTGRSRGKMANVVFSTWKGQNVLKAKPIEVANPNTVPQQNIRARMALTVLLGRPLLAMLQQAFKEAALGKSEWNVFVQQSIQAFTASSGVASITAPSAFTVSKGSLAPVIGATTGSGVGSVTFSWTDNTNGSTGLASDKFVFVAINATTGHSEFQDTGAHRDDATASVTFDNGATASGNWRFYIACYRTSDGKAGDSMYAPHS